MPKCSYLNDYLSSRPFLYLELHHISQFHRYRSINILDRHFLYILLLCTRFFLNIKNQMINDLGWYFMNLEIAYIYSIHEFTNTQIHWHQHINIFMIYEQMNQIIYLKIWYLDGTIRCIL